MSSVAICTDTSALVPAEVAARPEVVVVPIPVALDGERVDDADDIDAFYRRLEAGATATSSQPSPGEFLAAYGSAVGRGATEVLSIHLDGRVSGTVASAELAAREAPVPVRVVDTGTASFGVGVCVRAAVELVAAGASLAEAESVVRRLGPRIENVFVAPGAPEGRVAASRRWAVLTLAQGVVRSPASARSERDATRAMAGLVGSSAHPVCAAVGHAAAVTEAAADELAHALRALPQVVEIERYRVGAAVGAHTGPLSFGAFWWPAEPRPPLREGTAAARARI